MAESPCLSPLLSKTNIHPQILAAPGLATQLYREELVTGLVTLVKFHMQYNLLVLYDVKYRRMYRPSSLSLESADGGDEARGGGKGKKKPKLERQASSIK